MFELELSWVGKGRCTKEQWASIYSFLFALANDGKHERVPTAIFEDAEKYAKVRIRFHCFSLHTLYLFLRRHWKKVMMMTMKCSVTKPHHR